MQLYDWSPTTFHSIWNPHNCDFIVLDKDPEFHRHYRINKELSDPVKSSIDVTVTLKPKQGRKKLQLVFASNAPESERDDLGLRGFLDIPQPRLHQLEVITRMVVEQYGEKHGFEQQDVLSVVGHGPFESFRPTTSPVCLAK